jgi:Zn-dependent protease with chaperone function
MIRADYDRLVRASGMRPDEFFGADQIERARRYHRTHYLGFAANAALALVLLAWLSFSWLGDELYSTTEGWSWWARCLAFTAVTVTLIFLARLPVAFGVGYVHESRWGFSTQTAAGWLADRARGLVVALGLTLTMLLGLVGLARALPKLWPLPAAAGAALAVLLLGFVAPVVIEPLFNKFAPLHDDELVADLRALAESAQVPVRDVLVTDASRRTRKVNAYVSGLGRTRRVVLFDTLLERAKLRETRLVVAHELGHRRARHVLKGTLLAMAGTTGFVLVLWALLQRDALLDAFSARGPGDPRIVPFVFLLASVLELVSLPLGSALSRRWEREADYLSLELTRDSGAFESTHRGLALANLADLDPPRLAYVAMFSHPTPPERIAFGRRWAERARSTA